MKTIDQTLNDKSEGFVYTVGRKTEKYTYTPPNVEKVLQRLAAYTHSDLEIESKWKNEIVNEFTLNRLKAVFRSLASVSREKSEKHQRISESRVSIDGEKYHEIRIIHPPDTEYIYYSAYDGRGSSSDFLLIRENSDLYVLQDILGVTVPGTGKKPEENNAQSMHLYSDFAHQGIIERLIDQSLVPLCNELEVKPEDSLTAV